MEILLSKQDFKIIIAALKNSVAFAIANDEIQDCYEYSDLCCRLMRETGMIDNADDDFHF